MNKATKIIEQLIPQGDQNDSLRAISEGISNQADMQNQKFTEIVSALHYIAHQQQEQMKLTQELIKTIATMSRAPSANMKSDFQTPPKPEVAATTFKEAMESIPLLLAEKTYNTAHPEYDAHAVRNYPGKIFGHKRPCTNLVYKELAKMTKRLQSDTISDKSWKPVLEEIFNEAKSVPGAEQVFERKTFIENYMREMSAKYQAHYVPGWVNLEDALFLYWMIRTLKPKTVVQTGVCNGLSSAFMMLALARNGSEGTLHVIDLAAVFDPNDPNWTVKNKVYGVVIPEGKTSGWMVPDMYKNRFFVQNGDAKVLLPKLIDSLPAVDMFYHDSDHTYNHMMFEFNEAKRKLTPGGLIIGDDISWNESVWDFADQHNVPSYNYKGAVGVAFF